MDDETRIRLRAYEIWHQQGQPEGREGEHWEQARREVLGDRANGTAFAVDPDTVRQGEQSQGDQSPRRSDSDELRESTELG